MGDSVNSGGTTIQLATCACAAPALSATSTPSLPPSLRFSLSLSKPIDMIEDCASCVAADPTASAGPAQIMNYNGPSPSPPSSSLRY
jgi:hypothetical protein